MKEKGKRRRHQEDVLTRTAWLAAKLQRAKNIPALDEVTHADLDTGPKSMTEEEIQEEQEYLKETGLWPTEEDGAESEPS